MTALEEHPGDQQAAMAVRGVFFGTHDRNAHLTHASYQPAEPGQERGARCNGVVADVAFVVVERLAGRAAAELLSEEDVANPDVAETITQALPIEPRHIARSWNRANVGDGLDSKRQKQSGEVLERVVRVAHRPQRGGLRH